MKAKPIRSRALRPHSHDEFTAIVSAPFGAVGILAENDVLRSLTCLPPGTPEKVPQDPLSAQAAEQVQRYLADPETDFDLPLAIEGTEFQRRVWAEIAAIPSGATATYGEIAWRIGSAPRAVGQACATNRLALVIPCHRVVGAQGIGGFFGDAEGPGHYTRTKRWLLLHEERQLAS